MSAMLRGEENVSEAGDWVDQNCTNELYYICQRGKRRSPVLTFDVVLLVLTNFITFQIFKKISSGDIRKTTMQVKHKIAITTCLINQFVICPETTQKVTIVL